MEKFWNWIKNEDTGETELYFDSMIYSPSKTTASLMQKISALAPKGVPINQLDKRLALLK